MVHETSGETLHSSLYLHYYIIILKSFCHFRETDRDSTTNFVDRNGKSIQKKSGRGEKNMEACD